MAMTALLFDEKGNLRSFNDFKKAALDLHKEYDVRFLAAEYEHAVASAQMARKWQDIVANKELFPLLEYSTAGDERVRREHATLDGVLLPVDDPFWRRYYPPNGWGCRCSVTSRSEGKITDKKGLELPDFKDDMFATNTGITRTVFPKKHPYFKVAAADKERLANNFGLPIPD
jgi:SPP1 gp7 family putative phage head morphogenesis protein